MRALSDYLPDELKGLLADWGEPAYRARQIRAGLFKNLCVRFEQMTDLPAALRQRLADHAPLLALAVTARLASTDGLTHKLLLRAASSDSVETVSIREADRHTVCVSTQVGCAMGCVFCASGQEGLERNLSAGEIIEQVLAVRRTFGPVTNVVFMGMGEPLANYESLLRAIRALHAPDGLALGARRMTVSTVGHVAGIRRLAGEGLAVGLAVSLHAPDEETRAHIVPSARRWTVDEIVHAARDYAERTHRRVTFEYVLLDGINDSDGQARALAALAKPQGAQVNLIPYNPVPGLPHDEPSRERVRAFRAVLTEAGVSATIRKEKGRDIDAACGQLRRQIVPAPPDS